LTPLVLDTLIDERPLKGQFCVKGLFIPASVDVV
jgi:hypothetical protein